MQGGSNIILVTIFSIVTSYLIYRLQAGRDCYLVNIFIQSGVAAQKHLEAPEPPFSLIGICDLVPDDKRHLFEEAGGDAA